MNSFSFDAAQTASSSAFTFDLVVEGHGGVGHTLPADAVENSARHGEAHDSEDGLDVGATGNSVACQSDVARLR